MEVKKGVYTYEYPRPSVTTDCVIFGYDVREGLSVLLVERGIEPFKGAGPSRADSFRWMRLLKRGH